MIIYNEVVPGEYLATGDHVEYSFLSVILKTPEAWLLSFKFFLYR